MKKVYICSKLRGDIEYNLAKAKEYSLQATKEDCIPITPHLYFTQFLDDTKAEDRALGIKMGIELLDICDELWVYGEESEGMKNEIEYWGDHYNKPIVYKE